MEYIVNRVKEIAPLTIVCVALQQEVFSILNSIVDLTHWFKCVSKTVVEFMRVQLTEAYA